jgi:hypothetical protein
MLQPGRTQLVDQQQWRTNSLSISSKLCVVHRGRSCERWHGLQSGQFVHQRYRNKMVYDATTGENEVLSRLLANDIVVAVPPDIIAKVKAHE